MSKPTVVISRHWHHPQISVHVSDEGIGIAVPLEDFLLALGEELPSPAFIFTKASLAEVIRRGVTATLEKVKEASAHA